MELRKSALALFLCALAWPAAATVRGEEIEYRDDGTLLRGYVAYDDALPGPRPGVLVVHEWWGHNDYVRRRARMLAAAGYVALALDMYGEGRQAAHPDDARTFASAVGGDPALARRRFEAALAVLRAHPRTDPRRIAAIGYCFGGGIVLNMARAGADLAAVASFHGSLAPQVPARPGAIRARILVFTGGADPFVPPEQVEAFRKEMDTARADYRVVVYPEARHSFTNPAADEYARRFGLPLAWDPEADRDSWRQLLEFLRETFSGASFRKDS